MLGGVVVCCGMGDRDGLEGVFGNVKGMSVWGCVVERMTGRVLWNE